MNVGIWSIYENPKLDNKPSWTPLVFYSLVHLLESIDKNKKVGQIS